MLPNKNRSRILIAIGGNSLISPETKNGNLDTHELAREVCQEIATIAQFHGGVVITHGNGPQVGYELLRNTLAEKNIPPDGLDVNVASTQGIIGYYLQQVLGDVLEERGVDIPVVSLITQSLIDQGDPAFGNPTKPVGSFYTKEEADRIIEKYNWIMKEDSGRGWRRVVSSPKPRKILELPSIRALVTVGQIVICCGGGGVPVVRDGYEVRGVAAVVDKDHASALLATKLEVDTFIVSTSVPEVYINFGKSNQKPLRNVTLKEMEHYYNDDQFAPGSMRPKVRASIGFLNHGGTCVIITAPGHILEALEGKTGTTITK